MRRIRGGGDVGGSNYICSCEGKNNVDNNIVIKTIEKDFSNTCSLRSTQDDYVPANNPKSRNILETQPIGMNSS